MPLFFEIYYFFNIHSYNTITLRSSFTIRRGPSSWILIASSLSKDCAPNINKTVVSSLPHWILKCHYRDEDVYLVNYAFMYPSLSFIPTMSEFFRLCGNFSDYVGIFPTMWEFFRPCPISKEEFFPPSRNFSHQVGIFPNSHPICREKSPPCWWKGYLVYLMQKNSVGGSKNIPLTAEGIIRHM